MKFRFTIIPFALFASMFLLTATFAFAQSPDDPAAAGDLPQSAAGQPEELQVGTTGQPESITVTIIATNRKTGRLLGNIKIQIGETGTQVITPDPPPPGGYIMPSVTSGKQTVVAERFGYDRYTKVLNLSSESGYFDLKIDFNPWPGTPDVSRLASQNNLWNNGSAWPNNIPQNYQNQPQSWGYGSWNNSAINSYNYPNYYNQNTYNPSYNSPYSQTYQQNSSLPYASQYGNYQLSDQTINLNEVTNYRVLRNNTDGNYYLLLDQNNFTPRQLYFVDNGSGTGGLVFFSASPQALSSGYNVGQNQNWYVSLYSRNQLSEPTFANNTFSRIAFSPYEYARVISGQITSNLTNLL